MAPETFETQGIRVAIEGCGHGTLNAIYASVAESCRVRGWDGVDLLIIGGDFQSVRNAADLTVMSCPVKFRQLGDFPAYYAGTSHAPYLTVFIAGNHEASSHLWELYYGGWVAPNIYYMGAANVLRLGPLRIAGMSGIWKGFDYNKTHHERVPFNADDVKSFYHVRELDVRKLLLLQTQVDVGLSHDWPREVEQHGDEKWLFSKKPDFRADVRDGRLGNLAAKYVMDRLRPPYWFSAHMHIKFPALVKYGDEQEKRDTAEPAAAPAAAPSVPPTAEAQEANPDEIDLDDDDDDTPATVSAPAAETPAPATNDVSEELRAQLPASFAAPPPRTRTTPGQPVPEGITNKEVRFLALDKCLPGRHFLQLCEIQPLDRENYEQQPSFAPPPPSSDSPSTFTPRYRLQYDPEWLAITRVFHPSLVIGDRTAQPPRDLGEAEYLPLIDQERKWVDENITSAKLLDVPFNFEQTAPPHIDGTPEIVQEGPEEWTNPQTAAFCKLLGVKNLWDASEEERQERRRVGPPPASERGGGRGRGRGFGGGRGRGRGRGGRGRGGRY
ncbi:lariat debranching enzyme [Sarocladium implicatum]|nr:lariat debranching enzyme [Sarocladium implicatum]